MTSPYLDKPPRSFTYYRALAHTRAFYGLPWLSPSSPSRQDANQADLRVTRAWFAGRDSGWSPAERVRRALANADQVWAL